MGVGNDISVGSEYDPSTGRDHSGAVCGQGRNGGGGLFIDLGVGQRLTGGGSNGEDDAGAGLRLRNGRGRGEVLLLLPAAVSRVGPRGDGVRGTGGEAAIEQDCKGGEGDDQSQRDEKADPTAVAVLGRPGRTVFLGRDYHGGRRGEGAGRLLPGAALPEPIASIVHRRNLPAPWGAQFSVKIPARSRGTWGRRAARTPFQSKNMPQGGQTYAAGRKGPAPQAQRKRHRGAWKNSGEGEGEGKVGDTVLTGHGDVFF